MNCETYNKIETNHSDNIIINIKHADKSIIDDILPGYTPELYSNSYTNCELCWNCCYSFNTPTIGIPLKHMNNIFYIYGYFCSYNCGARYIFDNFNDKNKWNIYSLLNLYYNISYHTTGGHINPSPNRLLLSKFGGNMSINEYRSNDSLYELIIPPIIPVDHIIKHVCDNTTSNENKGSYKLCRKNKKNNKNNIYNIMNLSKP